MTGGRGGDPVVVILDDDPTGTQAVADVAVVTDPTPENLRWAFAASPRGFFVLTNSRSLDAPEMAALTGRVVAAVLDAARGRPVRFVSRSDSTLRGHVVAEVEAIRAAIGEAGLPAPQAVVFAPAFPRAGRITRDGVHLLREEGIETPVHETAYAADATFGYGTSFLPDFLVGASRDAIGTDDIRVVRAGPSAADEVAAAVSAAVPWIVCDAAADEDLERIAQGLRHADPLAERALVRCSPGLLPALLGLPPSDDIPAGGAPVRSGGLVIVGSHVAQTTRQLVRLLEEEDVAGLTLDVDRLADAADAPAERERLLASLAEEAAGLLDRGHVAIATSRTLRSWDDPARSLAFARFVSDALVELTRRVAQLRRPAFLVAKGGITSSDIATRALGIRTAIVRGRVGAGIVWEPVYAEDAAGAIALVPGNIGGDSGLVDAVRGLAHQRSSAE